MSQWVPCVLVRCLFIRAKSICMYRLRRTDICISITIIRDWVHLIHLMCHYLSLLTYHASGVVTIDNGAFVSKLVRVVVHFLRRV